MSKWIIRPTDTEQQGWYKIDKKFATEDKAWDWFDKNADAIHDDGIDEVEVVEAAGGDK